MIPPHAAYEDGRIIVLDDGPLHFNDLRELYVHVRHTHRRVPEVFYFSEDQIRWMRTEPQWTEAREYMTWPRGDPLLQRYPGLVDYIWGVGIARKVALEREPWMPRDNGYARATRIAQHGDQIMYAAGTPGGPQMWATTGVNEQAARRQYDAAAWKVQFGADILKGAKIDGIWLDEPKRPSRTTHEVW